MKKRGRKKERNKEGTEKEGKGGRKTRKKEERWRKRREKIWCVIFFL